MPCDHLDILAMLLQNTQTFEIIVRFDYDKSCIPPLVREETPTRCQDPPFLPSQIHTVLSRLHVANSCPADQATDLTSFSWPSRVATHSQSFSRESYSQIPVVASKLAVAISFPEGDHAKLRIVRLCPCSSV